ncbi:DUF397 domain-containing protein [Streptomyces sp. P01-B04]|uniref:DUF397 domain-containing protein n=1 Tax=Streptomyces poriferorum TaxID=2798799 RepID=A0ABY9IT22_9ACTN|nr:MULTISPECIES: DUF397 domain-containing protein [Streptomyces]MBW5251405.1 DUF397 domain-containing protein [Streptomyces poriferorum]MBW5258805.1 DUF397 domain-containing protein [Streptomyces poriferorum]MDP5312511.1 DUF397 domain-containing protein [Streptomyces sp. Alt4]WLQ58457.1 DUF397 domain-containing protein [Streptomyces sp. Alt2]WSI63681.1 DUF397 domain-containing protein [Streptomyces sp. NBC_01336]
MASTDLDLSAATWHKSSYSNGDGGNCLEVAQGHPTLVPVRDSKRPHGPVLLVDAAAWAPFVEAVKAS